MPIQRLWCPDCWYNHHDDTAYIADSEVPVRTLWDNGSIVQSSQRGYYPAPAGWEVMGAIHRTNKVDRGAIWQYRWNGNPGKDSAGWESLWNDRTVAAQGTKLAKCSLAQNGKPKSLIY